MINALKNVNPSLLLTFFSSRLNIIGYVSGYKTSTISGNYCYFSNNIEKDAFCFLIKMDR